MPRTVLFATMALLTASAAHPETGWSPDEHDALIMEVHELQRQVVSLRVTVSRQEEQAEALQRKVETVGEQVTSLRERIVSPTALPFLSAPPPSTDAVGVAHVAVLAPRVAVDAARAHDTVFLRLRRVEPTTIRNVAELELGRDELAVDLPLDQNGALYIVDWSTSDGHSYTLQLRDGSGGPDAGGPPAATAQIKPQQSQGRFIFVGYRIE